MSTAASYDVAIIGGGPAGATVGCLLKKYAPDIKVAIFERESFPRDHVGESQLPGCSRILHEMGCWEAVEAANFPVKLGATFLWGKSDDLWDFDLAPPALLGELPRPGHYQGVRQKLAFQVDRAKYDKILLDHAASLGCEIRQPCRVTRIAKSGDRATSISVEGLGEVVAQHFVDASGHSGILRKAFEVPIDCPTALKNVAVWEYWQNARWAERIGVGATRIQVLSVGYGWIWFIPLGPERTSVGLVVPADYLKRSGKILPELYELAIKGQPRVASLMEQAVAEGKLQTTNDWSYVAARHSGENWFLVGESSGFADPILSAGLTMTHVAAREAAFTILEQRRGGDAVWLRREYDSRQTRRIRSHIRFADYWYSANAQFSDLKEFTSRIAEEAGLSLKPDQAWAWLAQGGFIDDDLSATAGSFELPLVRALGEFMGDIAEEWFIGDKNIFRMNVEGATKELRARYEEGRVVQTPCLVREGKSWPLQGAGGFWHRVLQSNPSAEELILELRCEAEKLGGDPRARIYRLRVFLEALVSDGWVTGTYDPKQPLIAKTTALKVLHTHEDAVSEPA